MRLLLIVAVLVSLKSSIFATEKIAIPLGVKMEGERAVKVYEKFIKGLNSMKQKGKKSYFFYMFSESVPNSSLLDYLASVDKLRYEGYDIGAVQYLRGFGSNFQPYMEGLLDIDRFHPIAKNLRIKVHPQRFKDLNITKVPAIVYAECGQRIYYDCDIKYVVRGDVKLEEFIKLMSEDNDTYEQLYHDLAEAR